MAGFWWCLPLPDVEKDDSVSDCTTDRLPKSGSTIPQLTNQTWHSQKSSLTLGRPSERGLFEIYVVVWRQITDASLTIACTRYKLLWHKIRLWWNKHSVWSLTPAASNACLHIATYMSWWLGAHAYPPIIPSKWFNLLYLLFTFSLYVFRGNLLSRQRCRRKNNLDWTLPFHMTWISLIKLHKDLTDSGELDNHQQP